MFKVNQKVWCAIYGAGIVVEIQHASEGAYPVEVRFNNGRTCIYTSDGKYCADSSIVLFPYPIEVVKSVTKPSIDWSHVSSKYNYLAQDSNGQGYLCSENPSRHTLAWVMDSPFIRATTFTSYEPGTCDWEESLVKRPE